MQTFHQNLVLVFDIFEIDQLKQLLKIKPNKINRKLSPGDIDYTYILN